MILIALGLAHTCTRGGSTLSIHDSEWAELERVFRNTFNLTPQSIKETHPELTKGDIRIYILSHLQFSVSDQATLLGISPSSVTKARQRLKAKL